MAEPGNNRIPTLDLMQCKTDATLFFVVDGTRDSTDSTALSNEKKQFFYEEYTCPTNFILCREIISHGESDPHGIFKFIRFIDRPKKAENEEFDWKILFPEAFKC